MLPPREQELGENMMKIKNMSTKVNGLTLHNCRQISFIRIIDDCEVGEATV